MRILFVDHPQFTSGSHFLWHGLNEVLPAGSVVVHPDIPTHYDAHRFDLRDLDWFRRMSKCVGEGGLPHGIPPFAAGEGLTGGGQTEIERYGLSARFPRPEGASGAGLVDQIRAGVFDLIVLANSHRVPTIALAQLRDAVGRLPPVVYYDAGERDELNEHWVHVFRPSVVFKQILTPETLAKGMTVPIPGYRLDMLPLPLSSVTVDRPEIRLGPLSLSDLKGSDGPSDKFLDVFFAMGPTWPARELATRTLEDLVLRRRLNFVRDASFANYNLLLSRSRMAVTMRGSGRDTLRYWEIPLYRTLMVCDGTMGALHPFPFEHEKNALFYSSIDGLVGAVESNLPRSGDGARRLEEMAEAGKRHLWRHHSSAARAVFFLDRLDERLHILDAGSRAAIDRWKESRGWGSEDWTPQAHGGNL